MKKKTPRGIRNCNPGNIRINNDFFQGEIIPSQDESFKQFNSMAYGYRAMFKIIRNYINIYKLNTIGKIIPRWAPAGENHTEKYIKTVCDRAGLNRNDIVHPNHREQMCRIVSAMSYVENGIDADWADIAAGWELL